MKPRHRAGGRGSRVLHNETDTCGLWFVLSFQFGVSAGGDGWLWRDNYEI